MKTYEGKLIGKGKRVAIIVARFNQLISKHLVEGAIDCLTRHMVDEDAIEIYKVPGVLEIPQILKLVLDKGEVDGMICLGAVIRGDTPHFEFIAATVFRSIQSIAINYKIPVTTGIITADSEDQALSRAGLKAGNKGYDAALYLLEMMGLVENI
ncbi:6,7-dimethyl-8-ribityllumazine synthase [candidate division bacterium WOR-3 4484_18]|uniref:6,7-dimethyl-8-ribityllumazine synthase n=1 Tax=candidate division WOR-3 bacterium 4484_18 TaxID=2020626 RepID=A0A257LSH0_UNCW3|nr:MAG: 6,7-dimethyl-8-ribityllumazine synthase [candidate division bacterium WOR-3 4484_18]